MKYVLFAEDDTTLRNGLEDALRSEGYEVLGCKDGNEVLAAFRTRKPDLLLLDVMMPGKSGYDVCAEVRHTDSLVPILFLTAKAGESDCVMGLGLGADDFIPKPFRVRELLARIAAALRRVEAAENNAGLGAVFKIGEAVIDPARFTVRVPGEAEMSLTVHELGLLKTFVAHPGVVLTRDALLDAVWGENYFPSSRTLDQHILQVRRKLGTASDRIETIRGAGYRLRA